MVLPTSVLPFVSGFTTPSSPPSLFLEGSGERSSLTKKKKGKQKKKSFFVSLCERATTHQFSLLLSESM